MHEIHRSPQDDHSIPQHFAVQYDQHLKHLKLKGLQPKIAAVHGVFDEDSKDLGRMAARSGSVWGGCKKAIFLSDGCVAVPHGGVQQPVQIAVRVAKTI